MKPSHVNKSGKNTAFFVAGKNDFVTKYVAANRNQKKISTANVNKEIIPLENVVTTSVITPNAQAEASDIPKPKSAPPCKQSQANWINP